MGRPVGHDGKAGAWAAAAVAGTVPLADFLPLGGVR
jgi:hypothetical protein